MVIVGWTGDAEILCNGCAEDRWGKAIWLDDPDNRMLDSEGNEVRPIFSTDEAAVDNCFCCGDELL